MANKQKIFFRADAGPEIGYGHFIRSLALADMLKQDFDCTMFTQSPTEYQLNEAKEICPIVALPADSSKFGKFLEYLQGDEIVVLDNYFYDTDYQRAIKSKGCKLVCIDDMHDRHFVADYIINSAPDVNASRYDVVPQTQLHLGLDFIMMRKPFRQATRKTYHSHLRKSIFVCFGGSDEHDLTYSACKVLLQHTDLPIHAVVGGHYNGLDRLQSLDPSRLSIHQNLNAQQMVGLMSEAVFAVVPLSTTFYETCCTRTPVITGYNADNQLSMAHSDKNNMMSCNLGDLLVNFERKLTQAITYLTEERCQQMVQKQIEYVVDTEENFIELFKLISMKERKYFGTVSREEAKADLIELLDLRENPYHPLAFISAPECVEMGKNVSMSFLTEIHARGSKVVIKDNCDIAAFVSINVADSHKRCIGLTDSIEKGPITLEENVFVGSHCFIGKNTHIGHHSVVAAGTIIVNGGDIPPYSLIKGNPAKVYPGYYDKYIDNGNNV